ncbi:MAG: IS3 family transposase [Bacteroidales bacterium]|nr:IS3 family transposase [Bacteroidales bacterium]
MSKKDDALSLGTQCRLLNISKSGLYYTPVEESAENLEIMKEMDKRHVDQPTHGVLQMQDYLLSLGYLVNHKRVRRLMRKARIHARYPKRNLSKVGMAKYIHPYLLRGLAVERPGQVWSIDITYIPMSSGFMYLTAKHQEAIDQNCLLPSLGLYKDQYRVYTKMKTLFYLNYW